MKPIVENLETTSSYEVHGSGPAPTTSVTNNKNEMIERVARVTYNKYFENLIGCCEPAFDALPEDHKDRLKESAKAAIEAMREPTEEMENIKPMSISYTNKEIWNMFIDAVLKE